MFSYYSWQFDSILFYSRNIYKNILAETKPEIPQFLPQPVHVIESPFGIFYPV